MEYILWCDESTRTGKHYSDFYGGILVKSIDKIQVNTNLNEAKLECGFAKSEIKWSKVTSHYLENYMGFVSAVFNELKSKRIKIRIMFRQSAYQTTNLSSYNKDRRYHLLYYQFIKHAFGLKFSNETGNPIYIRTYFDKLPEKEKDNELFKNHIYGLQSLRDFEKADLKIRRGDITEIDSKKHIESQAIDLILGAMSFRLNDQHKIKPNGSRKRGSRTIAKEKLYKYINSQIRVLYPNFNVGISTGKRGDIKNIWRDPI